MTIRLKLAFVITTAIIAATAAAVGVFVGIQLNHLRVAAAEQRKLLMDGVRKMARESRLAKDPLMLLDSLHGLRRDRPEVHHCRVLMEGRWEDVGSPPAPAPRWDLLLETVAEPPVTVEVAFKRGVIEARLGRARAQLLDDMALAGSLVALLGLLLSFPLSWSMTRRIVTIESALNAIGKGDLKASVPALGRDEIARLAQGVNAMAGRLQELDKLKKTFVASVTHELRSPLGAIESYVKELLSANGHLTPQDRDNLKRIMGNASRLGHFVTNLLQMAKVERGKLDFAPRSADLREVVTDTVLFFTPKAAETGIKLESQAEEGLPLMRFDPDLVSHVLTNLVSNALKFTRPGGRILVTLLRKDGSAEVAVEDTGVGISAEDQKRIFAPFERVANPLRATGVGLGLAISKSIMELHGGSIGLISQPGRGSRFHFLIPINSPRQAGKPQ